MKQRRQHAREQPACKLRMHNAFCEAHSQIGDRAHLLLRQRDGGEGSEERHEERGLASADDKGDHILEVWRRALAGRSHCSRFPSR